MKWQLISLPNTSMDEFLFSLSKHLKIIISLQKECNHQNIQITLLNVFIFLSNKLIMNNALKKQPNCPYGNPAKFICVNKQCKKPGLICEKGESGQNECLLFHENCKKIRWSEIEVFIKDNPLVKTSQFIHLQQKIQQLFLTALGKIQSEHQKFRIWTKTYGHNLDTMKFIKVLMDKKYDHLTGYYMSSIMNSLFSKENKKVQIPVLVETEMQLVKGDIEKAIEKVSILYKAKKHQKPSVYSDQQNDQAYNPAHYYNSPNNYPATQSNNFAWTNQNGFTTSIGTGLSSFHQLAAVHKDQLQNQTETKESSKQIISTNEFKSKIIESLSSIEKFFQGKTIKSAKLLYRATEQNFSIRKFHELCDNIPDTLTLIHNEFGKKIGGYTPVTWTSDKKHWVSDKSLSSFIFSLDMNQRFNLNLAQFAIANSPQRGPTFGCCDICVVDNSNKQKSNCEFPISYNNNGKYVRNQETFTKYTGHSKGQFLIKEWEVFQLQFL